MEARTVHGAAALFFACCTAAGSMFALAGCRRSASTARADDAGGAAVASGSMTRGDAGARAIATPPSSGAPKCGDAPSTSFFLRFGTATKTLADVAVDGCDDIVLAGSFKGSIDFGGGAISGGGGDDVFVVKLDAGGGHLFSKAFGDAADQAVRAVASDKDGSIYLAGTFDGTLDLGGRPLTRDNPDGSGLFIAKLTPSGDHDFSRAFFDHAPGAVPTAIAPDGAGGLVVIGKLAASLDVGGGPLVAPLGGMFVAHYNKYGSHLWSRVIAAEAFVNAVHPSAVACTKDGTAIVAGTFERGVAVGDVHLASAGLSDAFVARFARDGAVEWARRVGDGDANGSDSLALDGAGDGYLLLGTEARFREPNAPKAAPGAPLTRLVTLQRRDATFTKTAWSDTVSSREGILETAMALDPHAAAPVIAGTLVADANIGGKHVDVPVGQKALFVARFDAAGKVVDAASFAEDLPAPRGLAVDAKGAVLVTGMSDARLSAKADPPPGKPPLAIFLRKIAAP